jgi:penicillin-binding protein 1A
VAQTAQELLAGVVSGGTGKAAQIGEFAAGKTGTTENYGDAWFVGFNKDWTVAVWVGYPDKLVPMQTEYHGDPVAGGTFPAEIWHDFLLAAIGIRDQRLVDAGKDPDADDETTTTPVAPGPATTAPSTTPEEGAPEDEAPRDGDQQAPEATPAPDTPAPQDGPAPETPAPSVPPATPTPDPGGGGGDGGAVAPG